MTKELFTHDDGFEWEQMFPKSNKKIKNLYLEYVIYKLLSEFDLNYMSKTRFYKILYLIYKLLKRRGIDIQLPYFWYLHGVVVSERALPVTINYHNSDGIKHTPRPIPKPEKDIDQKTEEIISETIKLAKELYEQKNTEELIDEVYKDAPLEFQRVFREFKRKLNENKL